MLLEIKYIKIQIALKRIIFFLRYSIVKFLSKFITYFKDMDFNKEELITKLNEKVKEHYKITDNNKLYKIEDAKLPLNVSNSNNNFSKIKYTVEYKISHSNKYFFNVYIHCYGNIIEDVKIMLNEINIELSPEDIKHISDFSEDFSKLTGETIK